MKRHLLTLAAAFSLALLLNLPALLDSLPQPASLAPADSPPSPDVAFEGTIHAVGSGIPALWVIDDFPVTVISTTGIISNGLVAYPGVWAQVEAVKRGELHATVIEMQAVPSSDLYDRIEALPDVQGLWQVDSTWVDLEPDTQLTGPPPAIGSLALVHGVRSANASNTVFSWAAPTLGSQVQAHGAESGPRRLLAAHI
jgi:hypothetical protein